MFVQKMTSRQDEKIQLILKYVRYQTGVGAQIDNIKIEQIC